MGIVSGLRVCLCGGKFQAVLCKAFSFMQDLSKLNSISYSFAVMCAGIQQGAFGGDAA